VDAVHRARARVVEEERETAEPGRGVVDGYGAMPGPIVGWGRMEAMWRATVKGVLARRVRLALTALAVVLGVTFVSGTYVLTDTLKQSFGTLFSQYAAGVDLVVRGQAPFGNGDGSRQRIPEGIVDTVRQVPGIEAADGFLQGYAQFVGKDGKTTIQTAGAPTFGISWSGGDQVGPARIAAGARPVRDGEVAMDVGTARRNGFKVGDRVKVLLDAEAEEFKLVGLFKLGTQGDFGAVSFAAFDPTTAQRVFDAPGVFDAVNVRVAPGTSPAAAKRALERVLNPGGPSIGNAFEITSAAVVADETRAPVDEFLSILNDALLGFAGVGLLVGGFIIFNTFTILVSQRLRELGLLRAMGASGPQVIGSVLAEAAVIGVFASMVGLVLGVALAQALLWLLPGFGFPVPKGDLVVIGRTVFASALVGIGVTMLAAVVPAIRAARTSPIAAISDVRTSAGARPRRSRAILGLLVTAIGCAIGVYGFSADLTINNAVAITFLGGFVIFLGLVIFGPLIARPLSSAIGRPLPAIFGVTGSLARGNAMRNPRRTSATAAALIVGLALVALVAIFADSLKTSVRGAINDVRADFILTAPQFAGFSPKVADRVRDVPGVQRAVAFRWGDVRINGNDETVNGADIKGLEDVINLKLIGGRTRGMPADGILLSEREAEGYKKKVGDPISVVFPAIGPQTLTVSGIYKTRRFSGAFPIDFIVSKRLFDQVFSGTQQDTLLYVKAEPGQAAAVGKRLSRSLAEPFPNIDVQDRAQYLASREGTVDQFLNVFIALLLLSEIIAVLGIVNTLMLSIYERTREVGLLRTVGTTRRQVWAMVCGESVIIAVIGCVLGLLVGLLWGWGVTNALRGQFVDTFSVPVGTLALFLVASVIAGVVAALLPAWHASRLDVLEAIAHE
jgi:putative ABC transport system permease protein